MDCESSVNGMQNAHALWSVRFMLLEIINIDSRRLNKIQLFLTYFGCYSSIHIYISNRSCNERNE